MTDTDLAFVQLAQLVGKDKRDDAVAFAKRSLPAILHRRPDLKRTILDAQTALAKGVVRGATSPVPVDLDSRLELLRWEQDPEVQPEPVWLPAVSEALVEVLTERSREAELLTAGLVPSKSLLFVGPPGVGKTLAARWLASQFNRPLLTLDLAAVMSSFLGRTGNNIRSVLDYAQKVPSVLLLDEFDAIAKRRDDTTEIGELKRLVTVLLQAVDEWPASGLLIAATNHPDLLDLAVWRRFDRVIEFPLPQRTAVEGAINRLCEGSTVSPEAVAALAAALEGESFADIARRVIALRRKALLGGHHDLTGLGFDLAAQISKGRDRKTLWNIAESMRKAGLSQRRIANVTGLSRDTIRRRTMAARKG
ncbi:MAG TPA: ATP-binding protein [Thermoanaerobaculia bacterium]|nr:ATP-binding protein [Thermoanaerobaculia bacterium]